MLYLVNPFCPISTGEKIAFHSYYPSFCFYAVWQASLKRGTKENHFKLVKETAQPQAHCIAANFFLSNLERVGRVLGKVRPALSDLQAT